MSKLVIFILSLKVIYLYFKNQLMGSLEKPKNLVAQECMPGYDFWYK